MSGARAAQPRGPLTPDELGATSVLTALMVMLTALGSLLPAFWFLSVLAALPLAVLAERYRFRNLVAATVAGAAVALLVGGLGVVSSVLVTAATGGMVGIVRRRGGGAWSVGLLSVLLGTAVGAVGVATLTLFSSLRTALLESTRANGRGWARALRWTDDHLWGWLVRHAGAPGIGLTRVANAVESLVELLVRWWWVLLLASSVVGTVIVGLVTWWVLRLVLRRLEWVRTADPLALTTGREVPGPLPLDLRGVTFTYPGAGAPALAGVDLHLGPGEHVVVLGENGSGKSTLVRVLAGARPQGGTVDRPGAPGLGRVGGTALVMQRPDTQVLGSSVAEDLLWGLPRDHDVDVPGLLALVGLDGMADHPTHRLSGGQMQRLALAAGLARRPALLVSDESTAMVDAAGRAELMALLRRLPRETGATVVHVTHDRGETVGARVVPMAHGRVVTVPPAPAPAPELPPPPVRHAVDARPVVSLAHVTHTYGAGTPWAHRALDNVTLSAYPGEILLVTGTNGSGKSTLARVMAGLTAPTRGVAVVGGRPAHRSVGRVAVAQQHPRLQLARPTVALDVLAAAGVRPGADEQAEAALVAAALARVHLPEELASRGIDELSGGQQRRVALAGLVAGSPDAVILDEPLAGLDVDAREVVVGLAVELASQGVAVVVISHDVDELGQVAAAHVVLEKGRVR